MSSDPHEVLSSLSRSRNEEQNDSDGQKSQATAAELLSEDYRRALRDKLKIEQTERTREFVDSAWQSLE